jgi:hypothetical protein
VELVVATLRVALQEKTSGRKDPGVHSTLTTEHGVMGKNRRSTSFQTPPPPDGKGAQCRRWLGSLEENMVGVTLTDYAQWENLGSVVSPRNASNVSP